MEKQAIYVIQFTSGLVKIGRSINPELRIKTHESIVYAISGHGIARQWVKKLDGSAANAENQLIRWCSVQWDSRANEWFPCADFELITEYADTLTGDTNAGQTKRKTKKTNRSELTRALVDDFGCEFGRDESAVFDSLVPELGVRAYKSGRKSFICRYTHEGKTKRKTIGPASMSISTARERARAVLESEHGAYQRTG